MKGESAGNEIAMNETVRMVQPSLPSSKLDVGRHPEGDSLAETIHVLLVDDERLSRVVVGNLLRKCSYRGSLLLPAFERCRTAIFRYLYCLSSCSHCCGDRGRSVGSFAFQRGRHFSTRAHGKPRWFRFVFGWAKLFSTRLFSDRTS